MSERPPFRALTLGALPHKVQRQFNAALADLHGLILSQVEQAEDTAERGPSLQTESGVLRVSVVLTVEMAVRLGEDDVSSVETSFHVDTKKPRFKAIRGSALFRRTGFLVDDEGPEEVAIPFPNRTSRLG